MSNALIDPRRIIPSLRSYSKALESGELSVLPSKQIPNRKPNRDAITKLYEDWNNKKSFAVAGDLLSSAFTLGIEQDYTDVADFVLNTSNESSVIHKIAYEILNGKQILHRNIVNDDNIKFIRYWKSILSKEPKNPIAWIELGLQYAILGLKSKADNAYATSLHLDSNNRYVVRTVSRYYQHYGDPERALHIVRHSANLKHDPWIMSAEIAYSNLIGRRSGLLKLGKMMVERYILHPSSISELSSALGTVELIAGSKKEVLKYCQKSLISPNSNSVAQVAWIYKRGLDMPIDFKLTENKDFFEYNTYRSYFDENYDECLKHAMNWQNDEPLSTRPLKVATYVQAVFKNDYSAAADVIKNKLKHVSVDHGLANNLIYFLLMANRLDDAEAAMKVISVPERIEEKGADSALLATTGLYHYRKGNSAIGKKYYEAAIERTNASKNNYLTALATANFIREEASFCSYEELSVLKNRLERVCSKSPESDVRKYFNEANLLLTSRMNQTD